MVIAVAIGALLLVSATFWGYNQYQARRNLEIYLGNKYQQAFYEMVSRVEQIQVLLGKAVVSGTPGQSILTLTDVWNNALTAQAELTRLPISENIVYRAAKFLSQTGDYAHVMARNNARGQELTSDNLKQLALLKEQAAEISRSLHEVESQVMAGKLDWTRTVLGSGQKLAGLDEPDRLEGGFVDIGEKLTQYPTLIYDGPFSDHITLSKPRELKGLKYTRDKAREQLDKYLQLDGETREVTSTRTIRGKLPAYNFMVKTDRGAGYSLDISQQGGYLINLIGNRTVTDRELDLTGARKKGREYLARIGYPNMRATYGEVRDNIAYISYAYKPEDIVYYPDIINLQLALDNGQVLAVEALSYLMSHHDRKQEQPELSQSEVRRQVEDQLDRIDSVQLAVIPTGSRQEVFTYEVRGEKGSETYLIYINAQTGREEKILQLISDNNGTFTL
ncbi:MAG: germination protein YpeB [Bacillota bacterium]